MRKKILFFGVNLFGTGGVESVLTKVANHLSINNEVTIISHNKEIKSKYVVDNQVNIIYLNPLYKYNEHLTLRAYFQNRFLDILKKIKIAYSSFRIFQLLCIHLMYTKNMKRKVISIINDINPDYVVGIGRSALFLGMIAGDIKCTKVGWQHNLFDSYLNFDKSNFWPNASKLIPRLLASLDINLVLSEYDKQKYSELGVNCLVMPNFVDLDYFVDSPLTTKTMISVGRLSKEKRFDLLIQIWSLFIKKNEEWKLYIYGEGSQRENLQKLIDDYDLSNSVFLRGFTDEINKAYLMCSINVSTSASEGFGLMAVEGMAAGLPFIAFDLPPFRDFVQDGKSGFLIREKDINTYVNKLELLANNFELRKQMSENCKIIANEYSINTIMNKWDNLFGKNQEI